MARDVNVSPQPGRKILKRQSPFSYACGRCGRCCTDMIIQVNPYEATRLASGLAISTTLFLRKYTTAGGTVLRFSGNGKCVFLDSGLCAVHKDRPLVCRLYPLGRFLDSERAETFKAVTPRPGCEGSYGEDGTVAGYLSGQETEEFLHSADAYLELTGKLIAALRKEVAGSSSLASKAAAGCRTPSPVGAEEIAEWLDSDHVVSRVLAGKKTVKSLAPFEKMSVHIQAIEQWLGKTRKEK